MTSRSTVSRRAFLKTAATASSAIALPMYVPARVLGREGAPGANEEIVIGFIGTGGRARQLMDQVPAGGRIVAIADCFPERMVETLDQKKKTWNTYVDYRQMLDKEKLDAVVVATPDHGRTLPCMRAMQAGLDVYAEKPLTAYVREGRILADAARKLGRVFQVGSQQRTMEINDYCCKFVRDGKLGELKKVLAVNYVGPSEMQSFAAEPMPEGADWDAWCGPTELRPYSGSLRFGWMGLEDYSGGEMTNWGAHGVDQIQWALGKSHTGPVELWPLSPGPNGKVAMRYADGVEVRFELEHSGPMGGGIFIGEECKMEINRNKFATNPPGFAKDAPKPAVQDKWEGDGWIARPHIQNWLDCIRSRELPNADVEIGHRSVTVCHLLNIARQVGRRLKWDPVSEIFPEDAEATKLLERPRREGYELPVV